MPGVALVLTGADTAGLGDLPCQGAIPDTELAVPPYPILAREEVRHVGDAVPVGQVVFFRSACAIIPVVVIYAWRRELMTAVRTTRPFGHFGRGMISVIGMFFNFAALARRRGLRRLDLSA